MFPPQTMANFCDQRQDAMAGLLSGSTSPAEVTSSTRGHFPAEDTQMEMLIDGTGGPPTPAQPSKKHFEAQPDAMEGGEVGMTTTTEPAPFKPSIKTAVAKPEGHGNLIAQDTAPTDLSCAHHHKRVFGGKSGGTESVVEEVPVAKRARADLDDSRVKAALDETAPSNDVQQPPSKKQVLDAANKQSHVLQDAASPPVQKFARKHFDPTDNALKDSVVLEHPLSGEKAPRPEKPIPTIAPSTAPIAGVASETTNRVKKLQNATNAPSGAGMASTEINKPVASHVARAASAVGAGLDSATQHHVKKGVSDSSVTASAHRAAMGGTDASACMKWD